ncbi:MAG: DUF2069 domain-containing protein [Xanthomonadaceae bacterium]|jgi:uncharacterized membrane protein|nr:DUF2069 domain-containing protein [Xanthomonadaceae bacterium]
MRRANLLLAFALLALQPAWYLWLAVPQVLPPLLATVLMALPILPALVLLLLRRPSAGLWAGIAALFYFSHGVMEAWASPGVVRGLALLEATLATALVFTVSWPGLAARRRRAAPPAAPTAGDEGGERR